MRDKDSYVFTSDRKPNQMLRRETITMDVNKVMHAVSKRLGSKPNITSHSFRMGYISQLWKDTKDIEFVRQTIGHRSLNSTSSYVNQITDEERENRISRIREVLFMYIGYLQDRKLLGYPALKDTSCGIKLVLITDSTVLLIRNLPLNVKDKSKIIMVVICLGVLLIFGNAEPVEAKDNWFLPGAEGFTPPISRPG